MDKGDVVVVALSISAIAFLGFLCYSVFMGKNPSKITIFNRDKETGRITEIIERGL